MKISYRSRPFLKLVKDGIADPRGEIRVLTQPYQDALLSAHNKLIDVMVNEGCAWLNGQSGTFIMGRKSYVFNVHHDGRMETAMYIDGDKCFSVEYEDGQWTAYSTRHWQYQEKD